MRIKTNAFVLLASLASSNELLASNPNIIRIGGQATIASMARPEISPTYTEWANTGGVFDCASWSPSADEYLESASFIQSSSDCKINQERYRQNKKYDEQTKSIINDGDPIKEERVLDATANRNYNVNFTEWIVFGEPFGCNNWYPDATSITWGESFIQQATDCEQQQKRSRVDGYIDYLGTETTIDRGEYYRTLVNINQTRTAIGTKDAWVDHEPLFTEWADTLKNYDCINWLPASSGITTTTTFQQQASDCKTDQNRYRQERERLLSSNEIRDKGEATLESQTLTGQTALRSYSVTFGPWMNEGGIYGCTNWSPATGTVAIGQSFTQTATDCKQNQQRTRAESFISEGSSSAVDVPTAYETKTITVTSTRQATGTYEPVKACFYSSGTHYVRVVTNKDNVMAGDMYWESQYIGGGFNSSWYYAVEKNGKTYHTSSGEIRKYYVDELGNSWREFGICGYY